MRSIYKKSFVIVLFSLSLGLLFVAFSHVPSNESINLTAGNISSKNESITKSEVSLIEAYNIGLKKAKSWNKNAQLVIITSVDDDEKQIAGDTGRRKKWNLLFANISTEETLQISIEKGAIIKSSVTKEKIIEDTLITPDLMKVDSTYVIENAKNDFKLKPGINWANGYHFSVMNNGKQTFLTVTGITDDNKFTQVFYDIKTGNRIGYKVQPK